MINRAYLSLGSNLGDRQATLDAALARLEASGHVRIERRSSLYETEPVGYRDQPWFLNQVVEIATTLAPDALLDLARSVEQDLGRVRTTSWGPRTVDIDILLYGTETVATTRLTIPHPQLVHRRFVLVPLLEIAPDLTLPNGTRLRGMLDELHGQEVRRVGSA